MDENKEINSVYYKQNRESVFPRVHQEKNDKNIE